jgi:hypothetical protein
MNTCNMARGVPQGNRSTTGIDDFTLPFVSAVSIYPKPVKAFTTIRCSIAQRGVVFLNLYNAYGKMVGTSYARGRSACTYSQSIDAAALPNGIYLCRLVLNGLPVTSGKVIVNR